MIGQPSPYYDKAAISSFVEDQQHREIVGGLWDELGSFQLRLLRAYKLERHERLLDIGCGSLRGGVHFVRYLDSGCYYGTDLNEPLLSAGYEKELVSLGLGEKLPREHLITDGEFEFSQFGVTFDRALAFSVFTHLPTEAIRRCLVNLAAVLRPGGVFHATFFEVPEGRSPADALEHSPGGVVSYGHQDPYHYLFSEIVEVADGLPWQVILEGDIGHPRGQRLVSFIRTS